MDTKLFGRIELAHELFIKLWELWEDVAAQRAAWVRASEKPDGELGESSAEVDPGEECGSSPPFDRFGTLSPTL
ncbi:uncharacterized protein A4U43_C07F15940 [Asparagus officinalis]|uniref:Uncharacterized protein n=1 Tax=Asparagus officinalis TaxID=4686 RepID=A0A5P1ECB8_ASPOF|nr:uncharacterized protein A4U43_C07F15940 [Asparagus officinalis]